MSAQDSRLLSYIERLERLEADKKEISADIRDVKTEAKSAGFDLKIIARIMAERRMTPEERRTERAMLELYRGAIGLLDGTPLGDAARDRMMADDPNTPPPPEEPSPERTRTVAEAREEGAEAFHADGRIIDNPYTAGDPRRAAWDEGFCAASGSDGMDIPEAWRRKPKKDAKGEAKAAAEPAEEAAEPATDPDQEALPFDPPDEHPSTFEDWPLPETAVDAEPAEQSAATPATPEDGDPSTRLDALVKRTRGKAAEAKAKPAKAPKTTEPKAAKPKAPKAPKATAPRGKRRPAGDGEVRP